MLIAGAVCPHPPLLVSAAPGAGAGDPPTVPREVTDTCDRAVGRLHPALDSKLVVAGRAAWQVLAGAADGRRLRGLLLCLTAHYGGHLPGGVVGGSGSVLTPWRHG